MAVPEPIAFAGQWLAAWNAHDLYALLEHFTEDVVFTSPCSAPAGRRRRCDPGQCCAAGLLDGGLRRIPDLRFEVVGVYAGIDVLEVNYRNQKGGLANEVMRFDADLVVEGHGTYLDPGDNPAGASG